MHMNQAVDRGAPGREAPACEPRAKEEAWRLKHMRWPPLRKGSRVRGEARKKLNALHRQQARHRSRLGVEGSLPALLDIYKSPDLGCESSSTTWCHRALRSRLEPMQKVARMLRAIMRNCCSTGSEPKVSFQAARSRGSTTKPV
jgi:hypothetical protein